MSVEYSKLWGILKNKNMKKIELQRAAKISGNILARLGNNEYVSMETIEKICRTLDCSADDILRFK
ncbi:XRE family transcriptional regulator [Roseburia sp. AF12-17LB]|jgi:putative transcriptional regulator|uniref:helix-turn-helix domain-containing protein n=1 Tax=Roseburia sp. AF12-17LB TaxID=2293127 RepID=UPI000E5273D8|nr:helix-turn-helix transcriptional regulator [Roseburia sp. AF12-17LB]RHS21583.1 XRE family transcriptional regulator [Roseburia sp. AF12-17LB]